MNDARNDGGETSGSVAALKRRFEAQNAPQQPPQQSRPAHAQPHSRLANQPSLAPAPDQSVYPEPVPRLQNRTDASAADPAAQKQAESNRISVSRLSRLFDAQTALEQSHSHLHETNSVGRQAAAQQPNRTNFGMHRDNSAPTMQTNRTSIPNRFSQKRPPPSKPPKPSTLSVAASSSSSSTNTSLSPPSNGSVAAAIAAFDSQAAARPRSQTSPVASNRPISGNPFLSQSERTAFASKTPPDSRSNTPSSSSPASNPFDSAEDSNSASPQYNSRTATDRPVSIVSSSIQNRLAALSKASNSHSNNIIKSHNLDQPVPIKFASNAPSRSDGLPLGTGPLRPRLHQGSFASHSATSSQSASPALESRSAYFANSLRGPYASSVNSPTPPKRPAFLDSNSQSAQKNSIQRNVSQESFSSAASSSVGLPPDELAEKRAAKRIKVVQEIIETERSFLSDMHVLVDVYATPSQQSGVLPAADHKLLFGHLQPVMDTSSELLELLEAASTASDEWIGDAFNQMMKRIETTYCDYCKHQDASLSKLAEYSTPAVPEPIRAFLESSRSKLQGRTAAWDLASLIVKPVQRVLKYPLLIRSLLKETEPDHPDYTNLETAFTAIELVAEKINEVKKRKDIVDKYVSGKGGLNVIHGITKRINRGAQQLKMKTGLAEEAPTDELYSALTDRLMKQHETLQQLQKDLQIWIKTVREYCVAEETIASCLEDVYVCETDGSLSTLSVPQMSVGNSSGTKDVSVLVRTYRSVCSRLLEGPYRQAETQLRNVIFPAIDRLLGLFKEPMLLMKKREAKLLDYERANTARARGDAVDKMLADSADAYPAINAQLIEELPVFMNLVGEYVHEVMCEVMSIQRDLYTYMRDNVLPLAESIGLGPGESVDAILRKFRDQMAVGGPIEMATRNMPLMQRWRAEIWGFYIDTGGSGSANSSIPASPARKRGASIETNGQGSSDGSQLVDLSGSAPAPRMIRSEVDTDAILRRTILVSHQTLKPVQAPLPTQSSLSASLKSDAQSDAYATDPFHAEAMYAFVAEYDDELDLNVGDVVLVEKVGGRDGSTGGDWWFGRIGASAGWFPHNYVSSLRSTETDTH